ncbi:hypothetical protein, partial [Sutterella wadsworthensis]|uniref:hypothetical protein n=1 Tax=Sutterella wadsworthensis TaxID=40545 RepID=UPI00258DE042
ADVVCDSLQPDRIKTAAAVQAAKTYSRDKIFIGQAAINAASCIVLFPKNLHGTLRFLKLMLIFLILDNSSHLKLQTALPTAVFKKSTEQQHPC